MRKRSSFKNIYVRTREMLLHPDAEWQTVRREVLTERNLFREYLIPLTMAGSVCTLILQLFHTSPLYAFAMAIITFTASIGGAYVTYRIIREYLSGKIKEAHAIALHLSVYCSGVLVIFHCLSRGMPDGFLYQLLGLLSLFSLRTLYIGVNQITGLNLQLRKSTLIITGLLLILSPMIIQRLLAVIFRIPAFNT